MAGEKFIALEETSQAIKAKLDNLNFLDLRNYRIIHDYIEVLGDTTPLDGVRNIKTINGEGYVDTTHCFSSVNNSGYIQLTIDDEIALKVGVNNTAPTGLLNANTLVLDNGNNPKVIDGRSPTIGISNGGVSVVPYYGYKASSVGGMYNMITTSPIFFKSSLKIDFISATGATKDLKVTVRGGFKV